MNKPDTESTVRTLENGRRVFGRFVLLRRLGAGGMGEVWLARDESLGVDVSLKFLPEHIRWSPSALAAHKAEALRARALTHTHIVRVHDFVEDAALAAIVMEFVDGRTLSAERMVQKDGIMRAADIAGWLPQLADALDYLHQTARLAHGDVKPANVLLRADGTIKLADFGVARELPGGRAREIGGDAGGTLPYLSPQRLVGCAPAPADDIYALGAMLYELLTGRPPFFEGDVAAQIAVLAPESIATRRRRLGGSTSEPVPKDWEETIAACLAKRAEDRPPSAGAVAARLLAGTAQRSRAPRFVVGFSVAGALLAGLGWWSLARPDVPPVAPAPTRVTTEYSESFDYGLAGWLLWGEPRPRRLPEYQGRLHVFDNNGDGIGFSGATSTAIIAAPQGFELETDVRLDVTNPTGCHLIAHVALTLDPANWVNALGLDGDHGLGLAFGVDYVGDTCWGNPPEMWRHAYFGLGFLGEDGVFVDGMNGLSEAVRVADGFLNRWFTLRVVVDSDRHVRLFADDTLISAPPQRISPRVLAGQRLVVDGRSAGLAGKCYHDNVVLRAPEGGTLQVSATPPTLSRRTETLFWNDASWKQQVVGGAAAVPWPEVGHELLLSGPEESVHGVRSLRPLTNLLSVELEVQPFLNSGGPQPDVLTVFVEQHTAGGWRRWAVEYCATEIWLTERNPDGRETSRRRCGTYAPHRPGTLLFSRLRDNRLSFCGSLLEPAYFASAAEAQGEWAVGCEVSSSADGVLLHPPRVACD